MMQKLELLVLILPFAIAMHSPAAAWDVSALLRGSRLSQSQLITVAADADLGAKRQLADERDACGCGSKDYSAPCPTGYCVLLCTFIVKRA